MILIVEDEVVSRKALASLLKASGFATESAESAEEALSLLHDHPPDVALVDLDLPGMSGLDLIRYLEEHNPSVHPVIVTASSRERVERIMYDHPIPCVRKPIDFRELLYVIEREQMKH